MNAYAGIRVHSKWEYYQRIVSGPRSTLISFILLFIATGAVHRVRFRFSFKGGTLFLQRIFGRMYIYRMGYA